jgi:hypothetical protein
MAVIPRLILLIMALFAICVTGTLSEVRAEFATPEVPKGPATSEAKMVPEKRKPTANEANFYCIESNLQKWSCHLLGSGFTGHVEDVPQSILQDSG